MNWENALAYKQAQTELQYKGQANKGLYVFCVLFFHLIPLSYPWLWDLTLKYHKTMDDKLCLTPIFIDKITPSVELI